MVPGMALLAAVWRRLDSPYRVLLAAQAAVPILDHVLLLVLIRMSANGGLYGASAWLGYLRNCLGLFELLGLCIAFYLAREGRRGANLGVLASAMLAVLVGGWMFVGFVPLVAMLWKDSLPFELCGGAGNPGQASRRAARAGFMTLLLIPVIVLGPFVMRLLTHWVRVSGGIDLASDIWVAVALVIGAFAWTRMSAQWGRAGSGLRVLTVCCGIALLLVIGVPVLAFTAAYGGGHGP